MSTPSVPGNPREVSLFYLLQNDHQKQKPNFTINKGPKSPSTPASGTSEAAPKGKPAENVVDVGNSSQPPPVNRPITSSTSKFKINTNSNTVTPIGTPTSSAANTPIGNKPPTPNIGLVSPSTNSNQVKLGSGKVFTINRKPGATDVGAPSPVSNVAALNSPLFRTSSPSIAARASPSLMAAKNNTSPSGSRTVGHLTGMVASPIATSTSEIQKQGVLEDKPTSAETAMGIATDSMDNMSLQDMESVNSSASIPQSNSSRRPSIDPVQPATTVIPVSAAAARRPSYETAAASAVRRPSYDSLYGSSATANARRPSYDASSAANARRPSYDPSQTTGISINTAFPSRSRSNTMDGIGSPLSGDKPLPAAPPPPSYVEASIAWSLEKTENVRLSITASSLSPKDLPPPPSYEDVQSTSPKYDETGWQEAAPSYDDLNMTHSGNNSTEPSPVYGAGSGTGRSSTLDLNPLSSLQRAARPIVEAPVERPSAALPSYESATLTHTSSAAEAVTTTSSAAEVEASSPCSARVQPSASSSHSLVGTHVVVDESYDSDDEDFDPADGAVLNLSARRRPYKETRLNSDNSLGDEAEQEDSLTVRQISRKAETAASPSTVKSRETNVAGPEVEAAVAYATATAVKEAAASEYHSPVSPAQAQTLHPAAVAVVKDSPREQPSAVPQQYAVASAAVVKDSPRYTSNPSHLSSAATVVQKDSPRDATPAAAAAGTQPQQPSPSKPLIARSGGGTPSKVASSYVPEPEAPPAAVPSPEKSKRLATDVTYMNSTNPMRAASKPAMDDHLSHSVSAYFPHKNPLMSSRRGKATSTKSGFADGDEDPHHHSTASFVADNSAPSMASPKEPMRIDTSEPQQQQAQQTQEFSSKYDLPTHTTDFIDDLADEASNTAVAGEYDAEQQQQEEEDEEEWEEQRGTRPVVRRSHTKRRITFPPKKLEHTYTHHAPTGVTADPATSSAVTTNSNLKDVQAATAAQILAEVERRHHHHNFSQVEPKLSPINAGSGKLSFSNIYAAETNSSNERIQGFAYLPTDFVAAKSTKVSIAKGLLAASLRAGVMVIKHGRQGAPKRRVLTCDAAVNRIYWYSESAFSGVPQHDPSEEKDDGGMELSSDKYVSISDIKAIRLGTEIDPTAERQSNSTSKRLSLSETLFGHYSSYNSGKDMPVYGTATLRRHCKLEDLSMCISLITSDRTFDIQCFNKKDLNLLYINLCTIVNADKEPATPPPPPPSMASPSVGANGMQLQSSMKKRKSMQRKSVRFSFDEILDTETDAAAGILVSPPPVRESDSRDSSFSSSPDIPAAKTLSHNDSLDMESGCGKMSSIVELHANADNIDQLISKRELPPAVEPEAPPSPMRMDSAMSAMSDLTEDPGAERSIEFATEVSNSTANTGGSPRPMRVSSSEALQIGFMLSQQESEFGTNMYESLEAADEPEIQRLTTEGGMSTDEALLTIFQRKYMPHLYNNTTTSSSNTSSANSSSTGQNSAAHGMQPPPMPMQGRQQGGAAIFAAGALNTTIGAEQVPGPQPSPPRKLKRMTSFDALQIGLLLSQQESEFGTNMYETLQAADEPVLRSLMAQGFTQDDAIHEIFKRRYVYPKTQQQPSMPPPAAATGGYSYQQQQQQPPMLQEPSMPYQQPPQPAMMMGPQGNSYMQGPSPQQQMYGQQQLQWQQPMQQQVQYAAQGSPQMRGMLPPQYGAPMGGQPQHYGMPPQPPPQPAAPKTLQRMSSAQALHMALMISQQEADFGINMYDSLKDSDQAELNDLQLRGYKYDDAVLFIFERRYMPDKFRVNPVQPTFPTPFGAASQQPPPPVAMGSPAMSHGLHNTSSSTIGSTTVIASAYPAAPGSNNLPTAAVASPVRQSIQQQQYPQAQVAQPYNTYMAQSGNMQGQQYNQRPFQAQASQQLPPRPAMVTRVQSVMPGAAPQAQWQQPQVPTAASYDGSHMAPRGQPMYRSASVASPAAAGGGGGVPAAASYDTAQAQMLPAAQVAPLPNAMHRSSSVMSPAGAEPAGMVARPGVSRTASSLAGKPIAATNVAALPVSNNQQASLAAPSGSASQPPPRTQGTRKSSFFNFAAKDSSPSAKGGLRYRESDVKTITNMGFTRDQAVTALVQCNNNVIEAINRLTN